MLGQSVWKSVARLAFGNSSTDEHHQPVSTNAQQNSYRAFVDELADLPPEERARRIRIRQQYERFAQRQRLIEVEDQAVRARH